ncbi:hypothetical protein GWK47_018400 [Chionoecetes opilio]|uniref:Endonuclease/exonuclease/phosphatase domain-containing protein n=1 Tax=Chionoecetes opilio TaxID=41210 RepID=A0A8J5BXY2_CHIOP|nr:hypothetical protein GWK47_018400 [Chionoecetes opilio]
MQGDVSHHQLIARPTGLPGYAPVRWCAVCGKKTANTEVIPCTTAVDCSNIVHTTCVGSNTTLDCGEVSALRTAADISAPVVYQEAVADLPQGVANIPESPTVDDSDSDYADLLQLEPRELVEIIRQLRVELARKKNIINYFETTSHTLADKRDAVVTVLDFIDNICATRSSIEEIDLQHQDNRPTHHNHTRFILTLPNQTLTSRRPIVNRPGTMVASKSRDHITIISANVRGLQTNIGDLINTHVIPHNPDIVAAVETFLNKSIPDNFGQINGYTSAILLCVCYRPQWQGREPIEYLHTHLDDLLQQHTCEHVVIIGDMNQHLVARSFDDFLTVYGLTNQVDFPTHISGSSLDPVISDLPDSVVTCSPLGAVGSSDHMAILSTIQVAAQRDAPITRTNWLWGRADWDGLCDELQQTPWSTILVNDVDTQVHTFTRTLLELQKKYVPSQTYTAKPLDKPWFGYQCRMAADEKSRAWRLYSRHPTDPNKERYRHACAAMKEIQQWAQRRWQDDLKIKLCGCSVGNKSWWTTLKQQQGLTTDDTIPPLFKSDGTVATKNKDKAEDQLLPPLQPLQQRRDVAGLCVVYKTHKQHVPHLAALRQPWARPHGHTTRTTATMDHQLIVPFARTEISLRSFLPRYTRMWNRMVQQTQLHFTS